jgi:RNA polymerase subunit RPABC4/transcription elongation factor Spt4
MESAATRQAPAKVPNPVIASVAEQRLPNLTMRVKLEAEPRAAGYGLPCANCRAYYPSDMSVCPICQSKERISATAVPMIAVTAAATAQSEEAKLLADERERLRELKSQIYAGPSQMAPATFRCALDQNHNGNAEPAAVCHTCYGEAKQQADRFEAALHIDVKEAAKIVYEAVWADPSDPNKTYLNAANALLMELRKRAGIGLLLGSNQPLAH